MTQCRLTVELDEPNRPRLAGETISGNVVVKTDKDVRCKKLNVTCYWSTHGRGNTSRGDADTAVLFEGDWQGNHEYRYPFKLATATWPPTHYGNLINVSHFVQAQASLPWTTDPKTTSEFVLVATDAPADLAPTNNQVKKNSLIGWIFAPILLVVMLLFIPLLLVLLIPLAIIAGVYWIIKVFIPSQITGKVEFRTEPSALASGGTLSGHCEFTPKRTSNINGITWTVRCVEKCVSGSGSKRSSHSHEVLSKSYTLADAGKLPAGQLQKFELAFVVPSSVPPSLKFTDNEIEWTSEFRIDIAQWPDWVKSIPFIVKASLPDEARHEPPAAIEQSEEEQWLTQVIKQVQQCEDDPERLASVLEAIGPQVFAIRVNIQGEIDEPLESEIEDDGTWFSAVDPTRNVRFALFAPEALQTDIAAWSMNWLGNATILGLEDESGRVIMRLS
jgi:hypothetical protein